MLCDSRDKPLMFQALFHWVLAVQLHGVLDFFGIGPSMVRIDSKDRYGTAHAGFNCVMVAGGMSR